MANNDDFEIINETGLSNEQTFELIDVDDITEQNKNTSKPTTPDVVVLPFLVSKPLVNDIPQVVQQQTFSPVIITPRTDEPYSPIKSTGPVAPFAQIKSTVPPPPRIFAPVPPLPKAPAPQRYGGAALIPHNLNDTINVDDVIAKSQKNRQNTLNVSIQQQQQQQKDIQTAVEQLASGSAFSNVLKAKEDLQKSPEQLEQEKRSIIAQRVPALQLDGKTKDDLVAKAKQLHNLLQQLHGAIYELTERFERQKYDMVELTERARQIEKGKAKTRKSNIVHTGLGGGLFTGVNDITAQAPQKVSLFSRYERVTDRRTYKDRRDVWASEKKGSEFVAERPKAKIKHITPPPDDNSGRKTKCVPTLKKSAEKNEEDLPPPPAADEGEEEEEEEVAAPPPAEEPPAEEEPAPPAEEQQEEEEEE